TPRRPRSNWSAINIRRAKELIKTKRMRPAGLNAFHARTENKSEIYSYEQRTPKLPAPYAGILKDNKKAAEFFHAQSESYRKIMSWWILSAKKEETRTKRLQRLIRESAKQKRIL